MTPVQFLADDLQLIDSTRFHNERGFESRSGPYSCVVVWSRPHHIYRMVGTVGTISRGAKLRKRSRRYRTTHDIYDARFFFHARFMRAARQNHITWIPVNSQKTGGIISRRTSY